MSAADGGPAFPGIKHDECGRDVPFSGMSLRDHFAGLAMAAYCSDPEWREDTTHATTATCAYHMADAMLEARKS